MKQRHTSSRYPNHRLGPKCCELSCRRVSVSQRLVSAIEWSIASTAQEQFSS